MFDLDSSSASDSLTSVCMSSDDETLFMLLTVLLSSLAEFSIIGTSSELILGDASGLGLQSIGSRFGGRLLLSVLIVESSTSILLSKESFDWPPTSPESTGLLWALKL